MVRRICVYGFCKSLLMLKTVKAHFVEFGTNQGLISEEIHTQMKALEKSQNHPSVFGHHFLSVKRDVNNEYQSYYFPLNFNKNFDYFFRLTSFFFYFSTSIISPILSYLMGEPRPGDAESALPSSLIFFPL